MTPLDQYFEEKDEPMKGCLLAIKDCMLRYDERIKMSWKWRTPFFSYGDKMLAYLTIHKKTNLPYLGFWNRKNITHPALKSEGRKVVKVYYLDPEEDIDVDTLHEILSEVVSLY
ncbi:MAG: DUF1801 domain-containing protein [Cyclobacteriaceae bacterium]